VDHLMLECHEVEKICANCEHNGHPLQSTHVEDLGFDGSYESYVTSCETPGSSVGERCRPQKMKLPSFVETEHAQMF
jgi:hypothetical protein